MSFRRRPLHTCGVSFLAVAHSSCSKAQDLGGPFGSIAKKIVRIVKLASPLVFALQYQWLLVLSFIDDRLLGIENIVEKVFPPSKLVFDKIDVILHLIESFPGKYDDAVNEFPFNEVTFLDWAVFHAISLLKFMMTILMNLGREGSGEKEISIDINCNDGHSEYELADKSECCSEGNVSSVAETQQADNGTTGQKMKSDIMKGTYKEVLEMGTKPVEDDEECKEKEKFTYKEVVKKGTRKSVEDNEDCTKQEKKVEKEIRVVEDNEECKKDKAHQSPTTSMEGGDEEAEGKEKVADQNNEGGMKECIEEKDEEENDKPGNIGAIDYKDEEASNESMENEDEILELFESAWLMKPTRKGKGNLLTRSASNV